MTVSLIQGTAIISGLYLVMFGFLYLVIQLAKKKAEREIQ